MGTIKTYLECEVLGGRKLIESAVIEGEGASEVLVSLGLMKKWDLIHDTFPAETVSDFLQRKINKTKIAYSSRYSFDSSIYNESRKLKEPSKDCKKLKATIMSKWEDCFKEHLGPEDRMDVPPVKLRIKEAGIKPFFCIKPYEN